MIRFNWGQIDANVVKLAIRVVYEVGAIKTTAGTKPHAAINWLTVPVSMRLASWNSLASLSSLPQAIHNRYDLVDWHSFAECIGSTHRANNSGRKNDHKHPV
jgi:hypothetical protein